MRLINKRPDFKNCGLRPGAGTFIFRFMGQFEEPFEDSHWAKFHQGDKAGPCVRSSRVC